MSDWYRLDGHTPVPDEHPYWQRDEARVFGRPDPWRVAEDHVDGVRISTVFLALDHAYDDGPPMLFETLIFDGPLDGEMERYHTWDEAVEGHTKMVLAVRTAAAMYGKG